MRITAEELDTLSLELARLHHELVASNPHKRFHLVGEATTVADIELETAFGECVRERLGMDVEIFGEEAVSSNSIVHIGGSTTLYLDAIDGTRLFVDGRTDYACTFAIAEGDRLLGGCVYLPGTAERYVALSDDGRLLRNGIATEIDQRFVNCRAAVRERDFINAAALRKRLERAHFVILGLGSTARRLCEMANWQLGGFAKTVGYTNGKPRLWGIAGGLVLCQASGHRFWFDAERRALAIGRAELIESLAACAAPGLTQGSLDTVWRGILAPGADG